MGAQEKYQGNTNSMQVKVRIFLPCYVLLSVKLDLGYGKEDFEEMLEPMESKSVIENEKEYGESVEMGFACWSQIWTRVLESVGIQESDCSEQNNAGLASFKNCNGVSETRCNDDSFKHTFNCIGMASSITCCY
ncbi:hypothetical protein REPUB_Repub18cG0007500 [Reevesia pubescens]